MHPHRDKHSGEENEQTNTVQPASYGWLQFTPGAIVDSLDNLTAAQLTELGLTAAEVNTLGDRARMVPPGGVAKWYGLLAHNGSPNAATVALGWAGNGAAFTADTGLSKTNYDRMVSFGAIGKTLKAVHNTYASVCSNKSANCYWDHWQADDPVAKQALLTKASTELGATQIRLNLYIKDPSNMGEARAGFQWAALTVGPVGQKLINILKNKANYDVLAGVWVNKILIKQGKRDAGVRANGPWTTAQELEIAKYAALRHNGGSDYPPKILPIFKTTFCADGNAKNSNGYLRMDPLKIGQ